MVALILLTVTVVMGVVASVGWATAHWPRFLSQSVHRNVSLLCVGFVAVHVVTTVSDGYVPIGAAGAFVPFLTQYRPFWIGLGALGVDLLLAVMITSALRRHIGYSSWRFVHWMAYVCWPIAVFHSLGSGSDASLPPVLAVDAVCGAAVLIAFCCRLATARTFPIGRRAAAAAGMVVTLVGAVVFAAAGPLRPGWSHRAGTSEAVLAQLAQRYAPPAGSGTGVSASATGAGGVPAAPFRFGLSGSETTTSGGPGSIRATFTMELHDPSSTPLVVVLNGVSAQGGGIIMSSGTVTFGGYHGVVTGLNGATMEASVAAPIQQSLLLSVSVDRSSNTVTGSVTGSASPSGGVSP